MKKALVFMVITIFLFSCKNNDEFDWNSFISEQLSHAIEQYKNLELSIPDSLMPRTFEEGRLITSNTAWWTSGFYPGTLWYLYEHSSDEELKVFAHNRTMLVEKEKNNIWTHDLGFMLYCSFGNGYRLTGNDTYRTIMLKGAQSLATRYHEGIGLIRSWDHGNWEFPVIIDNMMNLEFLFWAGDAINETQYHHICVSHADRTLENHFREDHSSWHVVDYDTLTGEVVSKVTSQGFSDNSAWSRGQSWGLYGYTVMYRETRDPRYLQKAVSIADFILDHPNLPEDMIPYWDFDSQDIPDTYRDASAAAIAASALLELSEYVSEDKSERLLNSAKTMIKSLGSPTYRSKGDEAGYFLLKHSVGSIPHNSEIDVPLTYADYYFVEALMRLKSKI